jgi:ribose transport system substrate-binding protein
MTASFRIAGIPQGSLHKYWKSMHVGAAHAVRELQSQGIAVDLAWNAPLREDDREDQLRIYNAFVQQGVDGILLAPFDSVSLVPAVEAAASSGVPTVVLDSALDTQQIISFVATDNHKAGALAAQRLGELLYGKGRVLILRYQKGSASTEEREEGVMEGLRRGFPGITAVLSEEFAGATRDTAKRAAEFLLDRYGKDLQGVFTPNESSTAGMLMALQSHQLAGKVAHVGFDSSDMYLDLMRSKQIQGLVVQDPFRMGEIGVKSLIGHLQGQPVQERIDTGATLITPENLDRPEFQELLNPVMAR